MHEWWHFQKDNIPCYHSKVLSALEERGMPPPPSKNYTPCSTSFSLSILPPKDWPDLNLHYLTKVSKITALGRWPACQAKYYSDLHNQSVFFPALTDCLWAGSSTPVTSSKRPAAARYQTAHDNSLALKWLWNPTASERDTDIIAQQGGGYWNGKTRQKRNKFTDVKGLSLKVSSLFPFTRANPTQIK